MDHGYQNPDTNVEFMHSLAMAKNHAGLKFIIENSTHMLCAHGIYRYYQENPTEFAYLMDLLIAHGIKHNRLQDTLLIYNWGARERLLNKILQDTFTDYSDAAQLPQWMQQPEDLLKVMHALRDSIGTYDMANLLIAFLGNNNFISALEYNDNARISAILKFSYAVIENVPADRKEQLLQKCQTKMRGFDAVFANIVKEEILKRLANNNTQPTYSTINSNLLWASALWAKNMVGRQDDGEQQPRTARTRPTV